MILSNFQFADYSGFITITHIKYSWANLFRVFTFFRIQTPIYNKNISKDHEKEKKLIFRKAHSGFTTNDVSSICKSIACFLKNRVFCNNKLKNQPQSLTFSTIAIAFNLHCIALKLTY